MKTIKTMKTMKTIKLLAVLFISSLVITSCSDDEVVEDPNEEELITTVTYTLTNGSDVVTLKFTDLDGEGGNDGIYAVSGPFTAGTSYTGSIKLENETEFPAEDITLEIEEEDDEHEFFFTSTVSGLTIEKTDVDGNGDPVGLETSLNAGPAGSGSITVVLKHEPTKPNDGTSADAGGSTDIEITFNVSVQ
jgi:hypothetical protein